MQKLFIPMIIAATLAAGCTTYHTDRGAQAHEAPTALMGPYYHTDWEVSPTRITATSKAGVLFGWLLLSDGKDAKLPSTPADHFFPSSRSIYAAKSDATYNALTNAKADDLLGAIYQYEHTNYLWIYQTTKCTVQGFPATMKGVKIIEDKPVVINNDQQIIRINAWDNLENPNLIKAKETNTLAPHKPQTLLNVLFPYL